MSLSRGFTMTLHLRSTSPAFPSPPPRRGWQRSEHCSQSFVLWISRQHVWVGTPGHHGARSGSWSPASILLHEPYEVQRMYVRSPPGRKRLEAGAQRTLEGVGCSRSVRLGRSACLHWGSSIGRLGHGPMPDAQRLPLSRALEVATRPAQTSSMRPQTTASKVAPCCVVTLCTQPFGR